MKESKVFTVLEINSLVSGILKEAFPGYVWVCGEIQGLRVQSGKNHVYFSLVQKDPDSDRILAKVDANLWAGNRPLIERRIRQVRAEIELKDDIEVKFLCEVSLWAARGKYQLSVKDIDPVYTLGKVAQNRLKIIEELRKKGLLEKNKLLPMPRVPLNIGLITADTSAAYHDFINELALSGYSFKALTYNCHMQGKLTEADIVRAMKYFNALSAAELDVVVVTRGGGSKADLSYFDSKKIAAAIANSRFPVISALGHQIDNTIADLCAHTVCKTPTKSAQVLVSRVSEFIEGLSATAIKIDNSLMRYFQVCKDDISEKRYGIFNRVNVLLSSNGQRLNAAADSLRSSVDNTLRNYRERLKYLEKNLRALDPLNTLKRGYSITRVGKKAVKSVLQVKEDEILETLLFDGRVTSKIESVNLKKGD